MTVAYTYKQYETLMKLVYLGNWMMNGIKIFDERIKKFDDDAGCGSLVEYDENCKKYIPAQEFEEDKEIAESK